MGPWLMPYHYQTVGFPVPMNVNPADHFIDMVSPANPDSKINEFVTFFQGHCALVVMIEVASEISSPGMTAADVLKDKYASLESIFGPLVVPKRTVLGDTAYMAPFRTQMAYVFRRAVVLKMRSRNELIAQFFSAVLKGVILGIAFLDISSEVPFAQVAFIFLLAQVFINHARQHLNAITSFPRLHFFCI